MPSDIKNLYDAILATIPSRLLPEMLAMLLMADESRGADLNPNIVSFDAREKALLSLKRRLTARTRGILEIGAAGRSIDYLHRTVVEWLE